MYLYCTWDDMLTFSKEWNIDLGNHADMTHINISAWGQKCADCGCMITPEKKKGKYVYYHCTQYKGKHNARI